MRIQIFNWQDREHPQAGGAETHLHEIFGRLASRGHEVHLLSCGFDGGRKETELDGIHVVRRGSRSTFNYVVPMWWLTSGRSKRPDIVIDDINKIPFFTPLFVDRPILGIIHHLFGQSIMAEAGRITGSYVRGFEKLIPRVYRSTPFSVVSDSTRYECLQEGLPERNLTIIHNGIEPLEFPMRVLPKEEQPTIVFFGRLKRYKSVDHVVRAFAVVKSSIPNARLRIVGRGDDLDHLVALTQSLGITESVEFRGWVDGAEKVRLLSSAHVVVNPSVKEGWGITNLEANACGTPVISADSPGLRDSVSEGVSGILYPYGNITALVEALIDVLTNDDLRLRISEGAIEWASRFTWDAAADKMERLCENTINTWHAR